MTHSRSGGAALARCVACPADTFAAQHWGTRPLLSRSGDLTQGFDDLFSAAAADELVSERGVRTPFIRMAKDGVVKPAAGFTRSGGAGAGIADQAADDKILTALDDGTTLVLQGLHRTWPALVEFAAHLADDLGHPVQINAYITPPGSQGFAPHHDTHDVFVMQIAGHKHWVVHRGVVDHPLESQAFGRYTDRITQRIAEEAPLIDTELSPGDCLYLPRGTLHSAQARRETSIHLTVGIHPQTRYQLVRYLADAVIDDPQLRASLPMGVDLADPDVLAPHLDDTVQALRDALARVPVQDIAVRMGNDLMQRTRPEPVRPLAQLEVMHTLDAQTRLQRRPALRLTVTRIGNDSNRAVRITFLDRRLELPGTDTDALDHALSGQPFTPADLPGLDPEQQLRLSRRLLREGLLVIA